MTEDARKELEQKAHDYTWETLLLNENDPTFKAVADAYIAGAEGYEKQKEINKELVDDIAALNKRIRKLEKAKKYINKLVETALKGSGLITKEELEEMREFIKE